MANEQTQLIIAYFNSPNDAETAAQMLKSWDKANDDIKLGAIGMMYQADGGKYKTKKYSDRNTGSGAKIGLLLGVLVAVLPAVALVGGAVAGAVGGGILGSFSRKGLGLTDEELAHIKVQLTNGKAALAVLAAPDEVPAINAKLATLGGTTQTLAAPEEIEQVAQEVNAPAPDEVEGAPAEA